jgi:hypothetical protein
MQEDLLIKVTELVYRLLREQSASMAELADRLRTEESCLEEAMDGERTISVRTLADIFTALGYQLVLDVEPIEEGY